MKTTVFSIFALLISFVGFSQDEAKKLNLRGPITPTDTTYANYKSYSLKTKLSPGIENSIKSQKGAYSQKEIEDLFPVPGLKRVEKGDFEIIYDVTRFELLQGDYVSSSYQRAPAYYIGMETNLEILDKGGKVIYKRYYAPKVKEYVVNADVTYDRLVHSVLVKNFKELIGQFEAYYLYGPVLKDLSYFDIEKNKKSKSTFNPEEFNQSVQVLPALVDVDRANWPALFSEAQHYWKKYLNYTDAKDEALQKSVRFAANYNLAATYLLLGQDQEMESLLPAIKENERSFMGLRHHAPYMKDAIDKVREYRKATDKVSRIEAVENEPELPAFKKAETAFKYAEFEGEVKEHNGKIYKGKIRIITDSPELVDWRTNTETGSMLGAALSSMSVDNATVLIYQEGQKKPVKSNLKDVMYVKDGEGKVYMVARIGRSNAFDNSTAALSTKRYALFEELKVGSKMSLYKEVFPQDEYGIKRNVQEEFYCPPAFWGRRKSLTTFFADCPAMLSLINKGEYDRENQETYLKIFEDFSNACKGK